MKWIKLKKALDGHAIGDLVQVDAQVAKAYIDAGLADDGGDGPNKAIEAVGLEELKKALTGYNESMVGVFKDAAIELKKGVGFKSIEPSEAEGDKNKSLGDFVKNVVKAANVNDLEGCREAQERLTKAYGSTMKKGMEESSGSAGGFWTTPTLFEKTILKESWDNAVILPGSTNVPLGARAVEWPALDQYSVPTKGNSAQYGGVTVSRKGENSQRDRTQAKATTVKLEANDLTCFTQYSRDLQEDTSGMLESMLVELIGGAIGFRRDWEHIWGTGEGMSLGILKSKALLTVNRATDGTVTWPDVAAMVAKLTPSAMKRAVIIAHPYLMNSFLTMTDPSGRYIYIPNFPSGDAGSVSTNPTPRLANMPVLFTEKASAPGSLGDFFIADRKAYLTGMRAGLEIGLSEHFLFDTDQIALRAKIRDDGQPWVKAPFVLADGAGTNKVSPFIGLKNHAGNG